MKIKCTLAGEQSMSKERKKRKVSLEIQGKTKDMDFV